MPELLQQNRQNHNTKKERTEKPQKTVLLILASLPEDTPYAQYYIDILEKNNIRYDILGWNRKGKDYNSCKNKFIYNKPTNDNFPFWKKLIEIYKYYKFVMHHLSHNTYSTIIIFTIQISFYMQRYLTKHYNKRYIFDIRDYSPIMKFQLGRHTIKKMLLNSALNCISSYGFKNWLPSGINYIISHNIRERLLYTNVSFKPINTDRPVSILTIGAIRDEYSNSLIIQEFGNDSKFYLNFVGNGNALTFLKDYAKSKQITNINFHGYYKKEDESKFVEQTDFINIYLPDNILSNHLLSNRFYLALLYKKPMIVNAGCLQADLVAKYNLGIVVKKGENIKDAANNYIKNFNKNEYLSGNSVFLEIVRNEYQYFENKIVSALTN